MIGLARLLAGLVVLVALAQTAGPATASCAQPSADFLDGSDVAFAGVVTNLRESGDDVVATVRVHRVYKGEITRKVEVIGEGPGEDSGITGRIDDRIIVFGQLVDGEVTSNRCSTIGPGKYSKQILAELGDGTAPAAGYMKVERRGPGLSYEQFSAGRAILGVLGLTALGYFLFRAWRARRRTS